MLLAPSPGLGVMHKTDPTRAEDLMFLPSKGDYRENCPLNKLFDFVKYFWIFLIFAWEEKVFHVVFKGVLWFSVFLKIFSTNITSHCPRCLFHLNNHKDSAGWVITLERISRWTELNGNINKKGTIFFLLFLGRVFPFLEDFNKILGWKEINCFPSSPICSLKKT